MCIHTAATSHHAFLRLHARLDEGAERWTWSQTAIDSLGSCMLVTIMLDLWRLTVGGVLPNVPECVPYM